MPEIEAFTHDRRKLHGQLRHGIEKECTSRLQDSATFQNPLPTPLNVFDLRIP